MYYIGVDPGSQGCAALVNGDGELCAVLRFKEMTEHDIASRVRAWWDIARTDKSYLKAVLEQVAAMPKQGVSSTFKFGSNYGFVRGVLTSLSIPFKFVTPSKWQTDMKCRSGGDKNVTKSAAQRLFPDAKITQDVADGILLAVYAKTAWGDA